MSDGALKRNRAMAALVALAITLAGVAWSGCGDDDDNVNTNEATESVEQGVDDAQQEAEEGVDDAQEGIEEGVDDAQERNR